MQSLLMKMILNLFIIIYYIDNDGNVIGFEKGLLGTEADVAYEKALDEQAKQEEESQEEEESNTATTSSTGRLEEATPPAASAEEGNEKEETEYSCY